MAKAADKEPQNGVLARFHAQEKLNERYDRNFEELFAKSDAANTAIASQGKTNWQVIGTFAGLLVVVVSAFWGLSVSPLVARQDKLETKVERTDRETRKMFEEALARSIEQRTEAKVRIETLEKQVVVFRDLLRRAEDTKVPTAEYAKDMLYLQRTIANLKTQMDQVFPPNKAFDDIMRRLQGLEQRTTTIVPIAPAKP